MRIVRWQFMACTYILFKRNTPQLFLLITLIRTNNFSLQFTILRDDRFGIRTRLRRPCGTVVVLLMFVFYDERARTFTRIYNTIRLCRNGLIMAVTHKTIKNRPYRNFRKTKNTKYNSSNRNLLIRTVYVFASTRQPTHALFSAIYFSCSYPSCKMQTLWRIHPLKRYTISTNKDEYLLVDKY